MSSKDPELRETYADKKEDIKNDHTCTVELIDLCARTDR